MAKKSSFSRSILMALGFTSLALGIVGIFLPLLPTTPFLLLTAWCFSKSSPRSYLWLTGHKHLGMYLKNYTECRAIPLHAKIITLVVLWLTIGNTNLFIIENGYLQLLLLFIACAVTWHVLCLRNIRKQTPQENYDEKK